MVQNADIVRTCIGFDLADNVNVVTIRSWLPVCLIIVKFWEKIILSVYYFYIDDIKSCRIFNLI